MNTRQPFVTAPEPEALGVEFNLHGKFTVATDKGYRVHDIANGKLLNERDFGGSVSFATNLDDSNIVGLIGGGPYPKFPPNKFILYDDIQGIPFKLGYSHNPVRACLTRQHLVLAFDSGIAIYNLGSLPSVTAKSRAHAESTTSEFKELLSSPRDLSDLSGHRYDTAPNPQGLCCLGTRKLIFPGRTKGQVQIVDLIDKKTHIIPAHNTPIQALIVSKDEQLLATASIQGTLIRVWSTDGAKVCEFRRGVDRAIIFSLAFSPSVSHIAATSDKSTLHIFDMPRGQNEEEATDNAKSRYSTPKSIGVSSSKAGKRPSYGVASSPVSVAARDGRVGNSPSTRSKHSPVDTPTATTTRLAISPTKGSPLLFPAIDGHSDRASITPSEAVSHRGSTDPYWNDLLRQQRGNRRTSSTINVSPDVISDADVADYNPSRKYGTLADIPYAPRFLTDTYSSLSCRFEIGDESPHVPRGTNLQERYAQAKPAKGRISWIDEDELVVVGAGKDARWEKFRIGYDQDGRRAIAKIGWKHYMEDDGIH